jgi:FMN phosphatase YigB (HAD superfamily)
MLVLFDLDDTLLDHRSASLAAALDLHAAADVSADAATFLAAWSEAPKNAMRAIAPANSPSSGSGGRGCARSSRPT